MRSAADDTEEEEEEEEPHGRSTRASPHRHPAAAGEGCHFDRRIVRFQNYFTDLVRVVAVGAAGSSKAVDAQSVESSVSTAVPTRAAESRPVMNRRKRLFEEEDSDEE